MAAPTDSTSSSMTSTSHTLTMAPSTRTQTSSKSSKLSGSPSDLITLLAPENRYNFIAPTPNLPQIGLHSAKGTLDTFAGTLGEEQAQQLKEQRKKRKRQDKSTSDGEVLKIRKIHIDGFEVEQVWEQARRVIDALRLDAEQSLEVLQELQDQERDDEDISNEDGGVDLMKFDEDGFEVGSEDESMDGEDEEAREEEEEEEEESDVEGGVDGEEADELIEDEEMGEEDLLDDDSGSEGEAVRDTYTEDPNGLNDGFFSLDDFNKQTEFLERQDANADPYTGEASDEEDIDWDADPMALKASAPVSSSRRAAAMDVEDEEEDDQGDGGSEDDGPTFGNADLNAPWGDSEGEDEDEEGVDMEEADPVGDNTNDVLYKDFFEPPPRKEGKGERQAKYLERQSRKQAEPEDKAADMERAIADVRRDLFDESERDDSEDALSDVDPADPRSRRSAHERKQAKIAEEIRKLEAASVAKREWTLSGEARAVDRPKDSLLDENLEFERTGKPVPVITSEISESIEELIKRRILAQEFDEVIRRRPDSLNDPKNARRGQFQLDDTKPQQSLAEMYEEEHVKNTNPDTYVSKSDEKIQKDEKEIEGLWKTVSASLDTLCSWHYRPKPAAPSLTVVSDVATIAMEDAQPTTASGINGGDSMLAPQEIYKAGKEKESIEKGEIVPKSGAPVARQEMTREEKLRRRRREKEKIRKRGGVEINQRPESKKTKEKRDTLGELKRGNVKVIGKRGEVRDVDGNKIKPATGLSGAGGFKL